MKTLIVHIEYDDVPEGEDVQEEVSDALEDLRDRTRCDIGWRFFKSLEAAAVWEVGSGDARFHPEDFEDDEGESIYCGGCGMSHDPPECTTTLHEHEHSHEYADTGRVVHTHYHEHPISDVDTGEDHEGHEEVKNK